MIQKKDFTVEIMIEPLTLESFRVMIAKKQSLDLKETKHNELKVSPYAKLSYEVHKNLKFYPAKVIYEVIKDYEGYLIPEIEIASFKKVTDTNNKYQTSYNTLVLRKCEKLLNEEFSINVKITGIKNGRDLIAVKIESALNFYKGTKKVKLEDIVVEFREYLIAGGLNPDIRHHKCVLSSFLKSKKYEIIE